MPPNLLHEIEADVVRECERGTPDAYAILFLLRRYVAGRGELSDVTGRALATALDSYSRDTRIVELAQWLELFVDANDVSDDERFAPALDQLVKTLKDSWEAADTETAAAAIDGCLRATRVDGFREFAAAAIDQLEKLLGRVYRPGQSVGSAADHVRTASALLTAYGLSGRLPYSMLAEELIQNPLKHDTIEFLTCCESVRLLCRLDALHRDADYRAAAVMAPGADYRREAERLLERQAAEAQRRGAAGAIYGVALLELESAEFL